MGVENMAERSLSEPSDRYEFDAPSHVVDFNRLENDDNDDTWFEQLATGEDCPLITPLRTEKKPLESSEEPRAIGVPPLIEDPPVNTVEEGPNTSSNIVTSWGPGAPAYGGARPKTRTSAQPPAQPRRVSKRKAAAGSPVRPPVKMVKMSKNSEDHELERIRNLQNEVAFQRKKNEASYKAALAGKPPLKKMALSTTVPQEFHFSTNTRARAATSSNTGHEEADSGPQTRSKSIKAAYVPMAQAIAQYEKRTPDRFHLPSRQNLDKGPGPMRGVHLKLTQPHSPHLMTNQRSRPTAKSSDEMEAEEVDKLQKNTFKAHPIPKKIMEGTVGVPEKKVLPPTLPQSPAFALKNRVRVDKVEEVKQPSPVKAPPVPHFGLPFQPQLPEKRLVEVCPFSFEEREREKRALKEKKLEKQNVEVPEFKAQLLPHFDTVVLPEKKQLEPTKPKPFRLLTDERGATKSSRQELMMKEEQKLQEEAATFKARPNTVTSKEPFLPKKEDRGAVAAEPFALATEQRAREWEDGKRLASEKEALRALMEERQRQEEEQQAKEEIARMRQDQVHKAQPIRHYRPVLLKKSERPLTTPKSPNFSDRFRL